MPGDLSQSNSLNIEAKQTQQQHLTMKQRQGLEVLFLSRQELDTKLSEILLTNPLIEVEYDQNLSYESLSESPPEYGKTEDESEYDAQLAEMNDCWQADLSGHSETQQDENEEKSGYEDNDSPYPEEPLYAAEGNSEDFLLYTAAPERPFRDTLLLELELTPKLSQTVKHAAENIIRRLDDDGILRTPLEDIAMSCGSSMKEILRALEIVQQFDPPGIAARSTQECLLLQLKRRGEWTPAFEKLLTGSFEDLKRNRLDIVAQGLKISMDELKNMFQVLRDLNMAPVSSEAAAGAVIVPEVEIILDDSGTFVARLLKEPRTYKLSPYAEMVTASDAGSDFAAKAKEGKNLIEAIEFRKGTILRLAEMLISVQQPFLESGPEKLRPFTMKQAAEYLNFKSESTISRAVASKYIRTPHGVFPFKYFFTSGYVSGEGQEVSRTADMELLKKLVDEEDKKHPLSDDKLSVLLNQAGHPVARRTVAKYRDIMNIPSSSLRKEHF